MKFSLSNNEAHIMLEKKKTKVKNKDSWAVPHHFKNSSNTTGNVVTDTFVRLSLSAAKYSLTYNQMNFDSSHLIN